MTTKLKWRLGKLPLPEEVTLLLKEGVLTKEEAREILFSLETEEDRDKKSLQEEIRFLRQLVQSMAQTSSKIVEHIKYVETPYRSYPWYQQYGVYCSSVNDQSQMQNNLAYSLNSDQPSLATMSYNSTNGATITGNHYPDFTEVQTF